MARWFLKTVVLHFRRQTHFRLIKAARRMSAGLYVSPLSFIF